jgi:hypothetical protein
MKGNSETAVLLVIVVMILFFVVMSGGIMNKAFGEKGLLEKYSTKGLSEDFVQVTTQKFMKENQAFSDSISSIFTGDKLPQKCSQWYQQCTGKSESPWNNKPNLMESDYDAAMAGIKCDNAPAIKEIEDIWAGSQSGSYLTDINDEGQKIVLVRNACKINLIDQIHAQQASGSGGAK